MERRAFYQPGSSMFCDPCRVTVVPKTRHSQVPIVLPNEASNILVFDPVPNPWRGQPLTKECNFPVRLLGVDACTKHCEFIGIIEGIILYEQCCGINIRAMHTLMLATNKPNIHQIRVFGCPCIYKLQQMAKWETQGRRGVHIGPAWDMAGYVLMKNFRAPYPIP